ncbi:hypothetical protein CLIB1423_08S03070 [[Candida] railenensis]|uniref:Uncharacterized protein n=1 Tax=[Candida] railenensis TaxID=45579 RepID=A0A9P0QQT2_9ASCO|nr:hypothetical protein CLIB1423_08S03070 [[Candida] railenensis]
MNEIDPQDPILNWQIYSTEFDLHRELSQVTKRGSDSKPQEGAESGAAKDGTLGRSKPSLESDSEPTSQAYQPADIDLSDLDSAYDEFMRNLTPCSSMCTMTSQVVNSIPYSERALDRIFNRNLHTEQNEDEETDIDASVTSTSTAADACATYSNTKIELLRSSTGERYVLTLNDLVDYVHKELYEEIEQYKITRDKVLQSLTVNHLLIYILNHDRSENLHYIDQVRLFHLGRSYKADRGISDPRYFTSQYFLKDLNLRSSPCFHLFIGEHEADTQSEYYPSTAKKMLLKSFVWREIVRPVNVSSTYAEALMVKLKRVKSNMRMPTSTISESDKYSQQVNRAHAKSRIKIRIHLRKVLGELSHKVQRA